MNVTQFNETLSAAGNVPVRFQLPSGDLIPEHYHVTEVGRIDKNFIDCGGTQRQSATCLLQTWTADDVDHRLDAVKLSKIMTMAKPILVSLELPVEVEYGSDVAARYAITEAVVNPRAVTFRLKGRQTECLAMEKCGLGECAPQKGCC